jgi:hypothetical protein
LHFIDGAIDIGERNRQSHHHVQIRTDANGDIEESLVQRSARSLVVALPCIEGFNHFRSARVILHCRGIGIGIGDNHPVSIDQRDP